MEAGGKHLHTTTNMTRLFSALSWRDAMQALTIIVSFDGADQAEELDHPAETRLHLKHKHTGQDLEERHSNMWI